MVTKESEREQILKKLQDKIDFFTKISMEDAKQAKNEKTDYAKGLYEGSAKAFELAAKWLQETIDKI